MNIIQHSSKIEEYLKEDEVIDYKMLFSTLDDTSSFKLIESVYPA